MLQLLKNKFFRWTILSEFLTNFGASLYNIVFVVYVATMFDSKLLMSIANSILMIPIFFQLWIAQKADETKQKQRKRHLLAIGWVQGFLFFVVAWLTNQASIFTFSIICFINIFSDCLSTYQSSLFMPIFKQHIPEEQLVETYSAINIISYVCSIGGQFFGVWLLSIADNHFQLIACINAVAFILSSLALLVIRDTFDYQQVAIEKQADFWKKAKATYQAATTAFQKSGDIPFITLFSSIIITNILGCAVSPILNIYFLDHQLLGLSYANTILIVQWIMIAGALLGNATPNDYFADKSFSFIIKCVITIYTLIGIIGLLDVSPIVILILMGLSAFLTGKFNPKINAFWTKHIPENQLAQVRSLISTVVMASIPLGTAIFSSIAAIHFYLAWGLLLLLAILAGCLIVFKSGKTSNKTQKI